METFGQAKAGQSDSCERDELVDGERVLRGGETDIYIVLRVNKETRSVDLLRLRHSGGNRIEENVSSERLVRLTEFGPDAERKTENQSPDTD